MSKPVHLVQPTGPAMTLGGGKIGVIACGKRGSAITTDWRESSCFGCAREAEGLQDQERHMIKNNARERLGRKWIPYKPKKARGVEAQAAKGEGNG